MGIKKSMKNYERLNELKKSKEDYHKNEEVIKNK